MTHRIQQILDAAAAAHRANTNLRAVIEVNRVRSVSEDQAELPALTVNYGADSPDEAEDLESLSSAVEILITAFCAGDSETEVLSQLLDLRTQSHIALMADMTFGLTGIVWETRYGGADAPALAQGERTYGSLTCRWTARYLMNSDDPQ